MVSRRGRPGPQESPRGSPISRPRVGEPLRQSDLMLFSSVSGSGTLWAEHRMRRGGPSPDRISRHFHAKGKWQQRAVDPPSENKTKMISQKLNLPRSIRSQYWTNSPLDKLLTSRYLAGLAANWSDMRLSTGSQPRILAGSFFSFSSLRDRSRCFAWPEEEWQDWTA